MARFSVILDACVLYPAPLRDLMDENVRDAKVTDYESLIDNLSLPDQNDRHVLAAAILCNADAIVTANVKDFPEEEPEKYSVEIIHPDDFICYQIELDAGLVCNTVKRQREALKNPKKTVEEFLVHLQKCQLPQTVSALRKYQEVL